MLIVDKKKGKAHACACACARSPEIPFLESLIILRELARVHKFYNPYYRKVLSCQNQGENSLTGELAGRPARLLRMLYEEGIPLMVYSLHIKQSELATQLGISRQALNVHLRKLRDQDYIRTGRGFIDVTEDGLNSLGISANPAFVFLKISPLKRKEVYEKISKFPILRIFRVAGDVDAILVIERDKIDDALGRLASVDGVLDTRTYISIQTLK